MESDLQAPVSVQHETPAVSGTVVVPVQVGDGVNQVVLSYDDALIAGDTTYIIQFVDEANTQATEVSGSSVGQPLVDTQDGQVVEETRPEPEPAVSEIEELTAESTAPVESPLTTESTEEFDSGSTDKSIAKTNDEVVDRPTISEQVALPDIEDDKHQKKKLKTELNKASSPRTRSKTITKAESISEDSANSSDKIVSPETDSAGSRRPNRRSIKKPARFKDSENVSKKKQTEPKCIKIPAICKKSLGLQDLFIEVEIEEKLFVSSLEKSDCENGFCKYLFRISKNPIRLVSEILSKSEDETSEPLHETEQTEDFKAQEDSAEVIDKSVTKKPTKKSKGRPKKPKGAKQKTTDESHDENKAVEIEKECQNDNVGEGASPGDGASPVEVNNEEEEEAHDCMEELDDIVKSEGILKADDENLTDLNSKNDSEPPDKPKRKRKRKQKEGKPPDDQNSQIQDKVEEEPKPKRKYVKRNAYNKDDANYTIRKDEKGQKIFACNICAKECVSAANILDHMCVHSQKRPVPCTQCGMTFKSEKALRRHSVRHTDKSFICDTCGAMFYSGADLKSHASVHANMRKFICNKCGKGFNHSTTLSRHKQIHKDQRTRHVCHICGATFKRKDHVQRHVINIHELKDCEENSKIVSKKWFRNKRAKSEINKHQVLPTTRRVSQNSGNTEAKYTSDIGTQVVASLSQLPEVGVYWSAYPHSTGQEEMVALYKPGENSKDVMLSVGDIQHKYSDIGKGTTGYSSGSEATNKPILQQQPPGEGFPAQVEPRQMLQDQPGVYSVYVSQGDSNQFVEIQPNRDLNELFMSNP